MPLDTLEDKIRASGKPFIDLTFPPTDRSVFDLVPGMERPFDVFIHWRRPSEFMKADLANGLTEPSLFYENVEPTDLKQGVLAN